LGDQNLMFRIQSSRLCFAKSGRPAFALLWAGKQSSGKMVEKRWEGCWKWSSKWNWNWNVLFV